MYKLVKNPINNEICAIEIVGENTSFLIAPDNRYYQAFKYQINHDEAQLEDADGVLMTPEQAKAYVATLP